MKAGISVWFIGISKHLSWDLVHLQMRVVEQMKERQPCGDHEAKVICVHLLTWVRSTSPQGRQKGFLGLPPGSSPWPSRPAMPMN